MVRHCFICGKSATGVDHVPPQSFFPKNKDLPPDADSMRENLITVPACDAHNQDYSKDDEVASYVILLARETNPVGVTQFLNKGMRAINRSGSRGLIASIFKEINVYPLPNGREVPTFEFDAERVSKVMERVARGLFFDEFTRPWNCTLSMLSHGPLMPDLSQSPYAAAIAKLDKLFRHAIRKGDNPAVFWYDWLVGVEGDASHVLRMCFYGGLRYYAVPV